MATTAKIAKEAKTPKYKIRLRNRCRRCGRPRAYLRKFALCRLCFRQLALEGEIAGGFRRPAFSRMPGTASGWKREAGSGKFGKPKTPERNMTDPIADMLAR